MHRLLLKQLLRGLRIPSRDAQSLVDDEKTLAEAIRAMPGKDLNTFLQNVSSSYEQADRHQARTTNALRISTEEANRSNEALREEREALLSVLESAPYGVLVASNRLSGACSYANPMFRQITGYDLKDIPSVIEWLVRSFPNPGDRAEILSTWKKGRYLQADGERSTRKTVCKDGSRKEILYRANMLPDERVIIMLADVTAHVRAEEALKESENRLRVKLNFILSPDKEAQQVALTDLLDLEVLQRVQDTFARANGVASIITDLEGRPITKPSSFCEVCSIVRETKKGAELCQLSDRILGEKARQSMKPAFEECHSCGFIDASAPIIMGGVHVANWLVGQSNVSAVDSSRIRQFAAEIGADPDRLCRALDAMPPSMSLERFKRVVELLWELAIQLSTMGYNNLQLAREIRERELAVRELKRAKEAAEAASVTKSEFLANMSHEIRTPMNGILGMTELAMDARGEKERREYLEMVRDAAGSLLVIIDDILDFSKMEAGRLKLDPMPFELRDGLEAVAKTMGIRALSSHLELYCRIAPEVPDIVVGDSGRIRQVLINLLGNAIKFTTEGYVALVVDVKRETDDAVLLHFRVIDTGIGIAKEKQKRIFGAFEQADGSTTRRYGGTGLGLSISSSLVKMMGGEIWVESELGRGSTLHFTANLKKAAAAGGDGQEVPAVDLSGKRTLIVDDHEISRAALREMVEPLGMEVLMATSGEAAVSRAMQAVKAGELSLILMNARLCDLDGIEVARRMRENPFLRRVPIVMLISCVGKDETTRCDELGLAHVLRPVGRRELQRVVAELFGASREEVRDEEPPRVVETEESCSLRVLVAEDNVVNQKVAAMILKKLGHHVEVVANGARALEALDRSEFDLLLTDIQMPELDGVELTREIRRRERETGEHLPIVALTAHAMSGDREAFLSAGMDGYTSKPVIARDLQEEMKRVMSRIQSA